MQALSDINEQLAQAMQDEDDPFLRGVFGEMLAQRIVEEVVREENEDGRSQDR